MKEKYTSYANEIGKMRTQRRFRKLKTMIPINGAYILYDDQKVLSFCSHDYLALASSPDVKKNAMKYLLEHGITASSESKDLYLNCQQELEMKLAEMLKRETALFFSSRYETNVTTLTTLCHENTHLFVDEASHDSLLIGAKNAKGKTTVFPHHQLDQLEAELKKATGTLIIATESVFSLTGAVSNLPALIKLAEKYEALLYVDDSHGFGATGVEGTGLAAHLPEIDIITGSFSKACGAYGGYIACTETIRDYLLNMAPIQTSYLFPPPIIGAIEASLDLIPTLEGERRQLEQRSHWLRQALKQMGFKLVKSNTPLITILFESVDEVDSLREHLKKQQILVGPTRSFGRENPRLNLALNVCHMPDHLNRLVEAIKTWQAAPAKI